MEYGVFLTPQIAPILTEHFVEARLHTDGTKNIDRILELQQRFAGHKGLPVYVVIDPTTEKVGGKFERTTTDLDVFATFLNEARAEATL